MRLALRGYGESCALQGTRTVKPSALTIEDSVFAGMDRHVQKQAESCAEVRWPACLARDRARPRRVDRPTDNASGPARIRRVITLALLGTPTVKPSTFTIEDSVVADIETIEDSMFVDMALRTRRVVRRGDVASMPGKRPCTDTTPTMRLALHGCEKL